jgi:hypothetical protein
MDFELIRSFSKPAHIVIGGVILLTGMLQLIMRKAGKRHRRVGQVYFYAMVLSFLTSFPASVYYGSVFLAVIGVFSIYLAFTGVRFAAIRSSGNVTIVDRAGAVVFLLAAIGMAGYSAFLFIKGATVAGIIISVFALFFLAGTTADARHLLVRGKTAEYYAGNKWLRSHIGRIVGSYIAAVTAFLVNVEPFGSTLINWLLPTLAGTILAISFTRKYAPDVKSKQA